MSEPTLAPVDDYDEKTDDVRSEEETAAAEGRADAVDQIPDYHETHPTLDTSGPEHDPEVQQQLQTEAAGVSSTVPVPSAVVTPPQVNPPDINTDRIAE